MGNLVDIVSDIVDNIDLEIQVLNIVGDKVFVCNTTKHLTIDKIVEDSVGNKYKVTDIDVNNWVTLTPHKHAAVFDDKVIIAHAVYFLHGTPRSTNREYLALKGNRTYDKTPFVWLLEPYTQNDLPRDSSVEASFNMTLFFLDWANEPKWSNEQHNEWVIKPMENLAKEFEQVIEDNFSFKPLGTVIKKPRARFGVILVRKDETEKIIDDDLSGLEVKLTLEVYDVESCAC